MTDISVTAANVTWVSGVREIVGKGGETGTPGQAVYLDTTTNKYKLADADNDATSVVAGILLDNMVDGRPCIVAPPGAVINWGATLTAGTIYAAAVTPGGVCPEVDLATGDWVNVLCIGNGGATAEIIAKRGTAVHA
jgi:hypothetical protein